MEEGGRDGGIEEGGRDGGGMCIYVARYNDSVVCKLSLACDSVKYGEICCNDKDKTRLFFLRS